MVKFWVKHFALHFLYPKRIDIIKKVLIQFGIKYLRYLIGRDLQGLGKIAQ